MYVLDQRKRMATTIRVNTDTARIGAVLIPKRGKNLDPVHVVMSYAGDRAVLVQDIGVEGWKGSRLEHTRDLARNYWVSPDSLKRIRKIHKKALDA